MKWYFSFFSEHSEAFLAARPLAEALQDLRDFIKVGHIYSYNEPHLSWKQNLDGIQPV